MRLFEYSCWCVCYKIRNLFHHVYAGEEPKESKTAAKEGNGESNGSSAVSDAAPQSGAIVPATGPRPDRVCNPQIRNIMLEVNSFM